MIECVADLVRYRSQEVDLVVVVPFKSRRKGCSFTQVGIPEDAASRNICKNQDILALSSSVHTLSVPRMVDIPIGQRVTPEKTIGIG